jgi:methyl-accepting chemotaxis protein
MNAIRNLSVKRKLTLINVVATAVALLVACALFMTWDVVSCRRAMVRDAAVHADMVGANSTAAVSFGDERGAAEVLASLRAEPHVREACLYAPDGRAFATYRAPGGAGKPVPAAAPAFGHRFADRRLVTVHPVDLNGQRVCSVYLSTDTAELYDRARAYGGILTVVFLASLGAALPLTRRLQRHITEPVLDLARTARAVTARQDYALRAAKRGNDELGQLTDDFNGMLEQVR